MATGGSRPPRFVPTLTEVVGPTRGSAQHAETAPPAALEAELTQRVLRRVATLLERRVREAVASVLAQQTSRLTLLLRSEIEKAVQQAVADALADEDPARRPPR